MNIYQQQCKDCDTIFKDEPELATCPACGSKRIELNQQKGANELTKFDFYSDPSHGWMKVKRQELADLGIESQISVYSYQKGDAVYLEEDSDAPKFMDAWEKKHQVKSMNSQINFHIVDRSSRIRTCQPFTRRPTTWKDVQEVFSYNIE